jgi:4-amino-4-deoxy-L-arabinose transferase-like glycosyltransferase
MEAVTTTGSTRVARTGPWQAGAFSRTWQVARAAAPFLVLSCLSICLFFIRLDQRDLWSSHEGRAAQDAQSLLLDKAWGLPRLFCLQADLQKPPLYYWLVAGVAWIHGGTVDAWSVRFPAAASAMGCVWLLYAFGSWCGRPRSGFLAAFLLASSMHFTWLARIGRIDMPLTLTVAVCVTCAHVGMRAYRLQGGLAGWRWFVGVYLAAAAALLLKGPIGIVLPLVVIVADGCARRLVEGSSGRPNGPWKFAHALGLWWGIPLVFGLVSPWFLWVNQATNGEFFRVFFWKHNVERGLGSGTLHVHPWWFYLPRMAFDFLPWSPLLIPATWWLFRKAWKSDPLARFSWIWVTGIIAVLSCSSFKRADYLLPAFPGAALLLGCGLDRLLELRPSLLRHTVAAGLVSSLCLVGGWFYYLSVTLPRAEPEREFRTFAATIRRIAPAPQPIIFFRTESHALAFHVGRPVDSILEWENVDTWASRAGAFYVVMPAEMVAEWPAHVHAGKLVEVARNDPANGRPHEQPLVLLKTCPLDPPRQK